MALKEFKSSRQDASSELRKHWFSDVNLDVVAWENNGEFERIEVLWDDSKSKYMWLWQIGSEGSFYQVDEGDADPRKNLSQLARKEIEGDYNVLLAKIESASGDLPIALLTVFRMLA